MAEGDTTFYFRNLQKGAGYLSMPQASASFGSHIGTGITLVLATVTLVWADAEAIWVEATAPVRARTITNARTICFMFTTPKVVFTFFVFRWTHQTKQQ
jgi:hypothetical protein